MLRLSRHCTDAIIHGALQASVETGVLVVSELVTQVRVLARKGSLVGAELLEELARQLRLRFDNVEAPNFVNQMTKVSSQWHGQVVIRRDLVLLVRLTGWSPQLRALT